MPLIAKTFLILAGTSALFAVLLGAFGAHGLKSQLTDTSLSVYQTAVQYHFYHSFALMFVALLIATAAPSFWLKASGCLFIVGILLFSGSLYCLAIGGPKWLGPITPIGGLCFILGWILFIVAIALKKTVE